MAHLFAGTVHRWTYCFAQWQAPQAKNAVGYILTGMGDDGARGIKEMADTGAMTFAQNEDSCVVFGMPQEAIKHGGVQQVINLDDVPESILRHNKKN